MVFLNQSVLGLMAAHSNSAITGACLMHFTGQQMSLDALRRPSAMMWGKGKASCADRRLQLPEWVTPHTAQEGTTGGEAGGGGG